jgi:hypothetical protein
MNSANMPPSMGWMFEHMGLILVVQAAFGLHTAAGAWAFLRRQAWGRYALALSASIIGLYALAWSGIWASGVHHMLSVGGGRSDAPPVFFRLFGYVMMAVGVAMSLGFAAVMAFCVRYLFSGKVREYCR